ncbi:prolyl oligopeptidase family serine peptidase [Parasediminibacterium paludis]|uniref:Prolyl oligopeptidase family serine peptidase n=1 Tax=Parasediminibacterium paludis TaxID=908966 RepID=A0ABV8PWC3_9BACT
MKILKTFVFLFAVLTVTNSFSQQSLFSPLQFTNGKGDTLNYRFLFPDFNPSRKYPLVIFLHGSGEKGNDNVSQLKWGVLNFATDYNLKIYKPFVIAPQCPINQTWSNFKRDLDFAYNDTATKVCDLIFALIDSTIKKFPIDTDRIYITGLSMGGIGTFDFIIRRPNLFAAAAPVCGAGDISKVNVIKHIPMWLFHGAEDPTVDAKYSLAMVNALTKAGAHPGYTQYPTVGHFSWIAAYSDPMFMDWLFSQNKANNKK